MGDYARQQAVTAPVANALAEAAPALSVVIPAHNEAANLPKLLAELRAALDGGVDYETVVVDDASDDGTAAFLASEAARWPRLRPIRHSENCGQSAALVSGVRAARGDWIATLDGDGQNDPADIPSLWRAIQAPDRPMLLKLVAGQRTKRRDTPLKLLSSRIANAVRGRLLADRTPDTGCGLKLFERAMFLELPQFDHMHRFLPALFRRAGGETVSLPVSHRPRLAGRSHYGVRNRLWVGIIDMLGVMWLQRRNRVPRAVEDLAPRE